MKVKNNFWRSDTQGVVVADLTEGNCCTFKKKAAARNHHSPRAPRTAPGDEQTAVTLYILSPDCDPSFSSLQGLWQRLPSSGTNS